MNDFIYPSANAPVWEQLWFLWTFMMIPVPGLFLLVRACQRDPRFTTFRKGSGLVAALSFVWILVVTAGSAKIDRVEHFRSPANQTRVRLLSGTSLVIIHPDGTKQYVEAKLAP